MAWSKTVFSHNGAPCSVCGRLVQKGTEGWTDSSQPRGKRVRCLMCGPVEMVTSPADPVAGSSALRHDKRYRGNSNLKGAQGEYLMGTYLAADLAPGPASSPIARFRATPRRTSITSSSPPLAYGSSTRRNGPGRSGTAAPGSRAPTLAGISRWTGRTGPQISPTSTDLSSLSPE